MCKAKAADAHDAGVLGLECIRARRLMLMMLGFRGWNAYKAADAHDAGVLGLECVWARQLML